MKLLLFLMVMAVLGLLGGAIYLSVGKDGAKRLLSRRLQRYSMTAVDKEETKMALYVRLLKQAVQFVASRLRPMPKTGSLEKKLQRAGLPLFASEFLAIALGVSAVAFLLGLALTESAVGALLLGALAAVVAFGYLEYRIKARLTAFQRQLGDTLLMMANALRSGFSFLQAVELVANDMKPPVSEEFGRVMHEVRLGISTEEALQHMSERIKSSDLDLIITAVLIQRQVGGNLAQIFRTISATINDRLNMRREIGAITAQGRLSGWVLGLMPVAMGLMMSAMNPAYLKPLFETDMGRIALGFGLVSEVIGMLIIRKIVNIDL